MCCFCLVVNELHRYLDFHIVSVLCEYGIDKLGIEIIPVYRFKGIPLYILGKLCFRSGWVQLEECFQKLRSVIYRVSVHAVVRFLYLWLIVRFFHSGGKGRVLHDYHIPASVHIDF